MELQTQAAQGILEKYLALILFAAARGWTPWGAGGLSPNFS